MKTFEPFVPEAKKVLEDREDAIPKYAESLSTCVMNTFNQYINREITNYGFVNVFDKAEDILPPAQNTNYKLSKEEKEGFYLKFIAKDSTYNAKIVPPPTYFFKEKEKIVEIADKINLPDDIRTKIRLFIEYKFIGSIFGYDGYDNVTYDFPSKFPESINDNLKDLFPFQYNFYEKFYDLIKAYKDKGYRILVLDKEPSMYNDCNFINSLHIYLE